MTITRLVMAVALAASPAAQPAIAGPVSDRIYQPVSLADTEVEFRGEAPQSLTVTTGDGLALEGTWWPPEQGVDQILLVFHGNSYNHMVMAYRAEPMRVGGRGVMLASYRGYGDNPGEPSEEGLYRDAEAWIAKARELHPEARIYLFGFSLGGAIALEMAARHEVESVATMGAFTRLRDMAPRLARAFMTERYDNLATITKVEETVLLLHGTKDEVVDPAAVSALEKAGGANVTRISLIGGEHWVPLDGIAERLWTWLENADESASE